MEVSESGRLAERFIGEPVDVPAAAFDASVMEGGLPGVPSVFVWRGREYRVSAVLSSRRTLRRCRNGSTERYVGRHEFRLQTECGMELTMYLLRSVSKRDKWTLFSMKNDSKGISSGMSDTNSSIGLHGLQERPLRVAVLVSGGGTNLQALIDEERRLLAEGGSSPYTVAVVISSSRNAFSLERAARAGIPAVVASPYSVMGEGRAKVATRDEKRLAVSNRVLELCMEYDIEAVVLAGFLTVLSGDIVSEYAGRTINLHPALLPKFGGVGMWGHHVHEAVLAAGEVESGCTVHLVDGGCDTGEIILQRKVPVLPGDTPETLYARIAPEEHEALVEGVKLLAARLAASPYE